MRAHHLLVTAGATLVAIAFVKFAFLGYQPQEGPQYAAIAVLGAGALLLADLIKERVDAPRGPRVRPS